VQPRKFWYVPAYILRAGRGIVRLDYAVDFPVALFEPLAEIGDFLFG
jgi:hypothetical protein